ncbi:MAG: hypothetical protein JW759_06660 [Candidatus Coatesbacteria bacterium]|nr:hypothetical protein [Candidatus Coatesbacteria bacterium]
MTGRHRIALTVGILVLFGLIASSASFAQGDVWPTYLYDARHSGRCPWTGPNGPFLKWTYGNGDFHGSSVTIATDGTLRFVSQYPAKAYALNPDSSFKWTYDLPEDWARCTPAIASDSSIIAQASGGWIYRIDKDGGFVWSYGPLGGIGMTSPVIADELNLVFCLRSYTLHAIYMSGPLQGTEAWSQAFAGSLAFEETAPAYYDGTVYVTGVDWSLSYGRLEAVDARTGAWKWGYPAFGIDHVTYSSPSISQDGQYIYFGDDGDGINEDVLYCVASNGTLAWAWDSPISGAGIVNAPAIGTDGTLYVVDSEANLSAIASGGTLKWSVNLGFPLAHHPKGEVIIDALGTIYVTASGGNFYGVSPEGHLYWAYGLDYDVYIWLSAGSIGTDGTLYFATFMSGETVYAFHSGSYLTNAAVSPTCGNSSTVFEFSVDCSVPPTVATLAAVQAHLDDGVTVVDLHFDSGVHWIGTVSSLAVGTYKYYMSYETWGGITGTYPDSGWLDGMDVDNTAPTSDSWCDLRCYTSSPIPVGFTSSDDFTGVTRVNLWYRRTWDCEGYQGWGDWTYLMSTTATVGVFQAPLTLEGRIEFLTLAEDCANMESKSSRDCWTKYDDTAPVTYVWSDSSCWGGPTWPQPIRVDYTVDESCTYEPDVELWYRYDGGSWTYDQKEEGSGRQGYFNFIPTQDGQYTFGCVTIDNCGNDEGTPSTTEVVIYDTTTPTSVVTDAPECDTDGTFNVQVAANDPSVSPNMSGAYYIYLIYQFNGGAWQYDGHYSTSCLENIAGTIPFTATYGDGVYGFTTLAWDCCGNHEAYPGASTPPDMVTIVDTTAPRSRAISPDITNSSPVLVNYEAFDATSGIDYVRLYWNLDDGAWSLYTGTGDTQTGDSGTFTFYYPGPQTNGVLGFCTRAFDNCGNQEAAPSAGTPADCSAVYDDEPPVSTPLTCSDASQGTIMISGESIDNLTGIASVLMWYRKVGGAFNPYENPPVYTYWVDVPARLAYTYLFVPSDGDGEYEFYFLASDLAGNDETTPSGTISGVWDTTPPESSCWADEHYVNTTPVNLDYTAVDATTTVDELWLYYRFGDEDGFSVTGSTLGGGTAVVSGNVDFEMQHGEGTYYFYTLAKDELGNWEFPPENADYWVMLDQTPPTSHCISPAYATTLPFGVRYHSYDLPSAGVEETQLWYSFNGGAWTDSGLSEPGDFGTFHFSPGNGEGTYDLCTRALDRAGNLSDIPSSPHTTTVYDATAPVSDCSCPATANYAPIGISFTAADAVSGVAQVLLYHRYAGGAWSYTGMAKVALAGAFYYDPTQGNGLYEFCVIAQNNAGLWEVKAAADDSCIYTGTTPTSRAEAPSYASEGTIDFLAIQSVMRGIEVEYSAFTPGSEVSDVTLWWRYEGGNWGEYDGDFGYTAPTGEILFPWAAPHGKEGLYEFFTILEDTDGRVELAPPDPDTWCIFDITAPWSSVESLDEVSASTIYLDYVAEDPHKDGVTPSGLYSVTLWYSYENGIWREYETIENAPTSGTIVFDHPSASDGTLLFYTIAEDRAGNTESVPAGPDDITVYDGTPPESTAGTISPYYRHNPNIVVGFTATDNYCGVAYVDLWYRYAEANSPWGFTGFRHLDPATGAGTFNFTATEGVVEFYTIATDNFGNVESAPASADTSVCYDVTPPVSRIIYDPDADPQAYGVAPIPVYYAASDEVSGLDAVYLYARFNGGFWAFTGLTGGSTSGEFLYTPSHGAGTYEFYTRALDNAGNLEAQPTGDFHSILYDVQGPTSSAQGPLYTHVPDINVEYVASDDLSGIALVGLWYRFGGGGWAPWLSDYGDSTVGTIAMTLPYGEGAYYIFTQAVDNANNVEDVKSTQDIITIYDAQEPTSMCYCAEYSISSPIPVRFAALDPYSSGIAEVCLQYNFEGAGWEDSGLCETTSSGTFDFVPVEGPGTYQFRTIATDNSGNQETPSVAECETVYDDVVPASECTCATVTTSAPFDVNFEAADATGAFESVALWVRFSPDYGTTWTIGWQESGMSSEDISGRFRFDPTFGDGLYQFYTIAQDVAGNTEAAPSHCDCWTTYTASEPSSFGLAPAFWNGPNIPVAYTASPISGATIDTVWLYWRRYVGPDYTSWHKYTDSYGTGTSGTIYFNYPVANALYEFFTVAKQTDGTFETPPWPWVADSVCLHDSIDPTSSCTSSAYVEEQPIIVNFTASDGGSGIDDVALFCSFNGGAYSEYGEHQTGTSGYFVFDPPSGQGTYRFYTIATDRAGNVEAPPLSPPDTTTIWDVSKPSSNCIGGVWPSMTTSGTISVDFTSLDPVGNGVVNVGLWYNVDGGIWKHSGLEVLGTNVLAGSFDFTARDGDGLYGFFTIAADNWGNVEDPPVAADDTCLVDSTAPESQCAALQLYWKQLPVMISFTATDGEGNVSGVDHTDLWYSFNGGAWTASGLPSLAGASGWFFFSPAEGDGAYDIYTVCTDAAGNVEAPAGADSGFYLDRQNPVSNATSPGCVNTPTIDVDVFGTDYGPAGIEKTDMWCRFNGGFWMMVETVDAATFTWTFTPTQEGTYEFATNAYDMAGNSEFSPWVFPPAPESLTVYDATSPGSTCVAATCAINRSIPVSFTAGDALSGVAHTELWVRVDGAAWAASGLVLPGTSGQFIYNALVGTGFEGFVEFYTIATDNCGNVEAPPVDALGSTTFDAHTIVDFTAPSSFCSAPAESDGEAVEITWIATDATAGVAYTELWYSKNSTRYEESGEYLGTSGTVAFEMSGEGIYHFYTVSVDWCGNRETRPAYADAITTFDVTPPESIAEAPEYANSLPIVVRFTASDNVSGVASTSLFYYFGGVCMIYGEPIAGDSGEFLFRPTPEAEGTYEFYTISTDNQGNVEPTPMSAKAATVYDKTAPESSCTSPGIATSIPISVAHAALDNGPAGLARIALWYRLNAGAWQEYTGDYGTAPLGSISFDPPGGLEGSYGFFTVAHDKAGNVESRPGQSGAPPVVDTTTVYDATAPESAASVSEYSKSAPIAVSFAAIDNASGIASIALWVRFGAAGVWTNTGLVSPNATGTFDYTPIAGEGEYFFYTIATDKAGYVEATPVEADDSTLFDCTAPVTQLDGPMGVSVLPIQLDFARVEPDQGAPIELVLLFYRFNVGPWTNTGLSSHDATVGTFSFRPSEGPGRYDFYSIGIDKAGNREASAGKALTTVAYDVSSPTSECSCESTYRGLPLAINYVADGTGSAVVSVELFYKYESYPWKSSGLSLAGDMGVFQFTHFGEGDGKYFFYTIATDEAGNVQTWDGRADCNTFLDTVAPVTMATAPAWTKVSPISVQFEAQDAGIGIASVELWVQYESYDWQKVAEKGGQTSGVFTYYPDVTGGVYSFYTIGRDLAGNVEAAPAAADASSAFDVSAPTTMAFVPKYTINGQVDVRYAAADTFSGIASVGLWCRYKREAWFDTGCSAAGTSGTISVTLTRGHGKYDFYTIGVDKAGNTEAPPAAPDGSCFYDTTRPISSCSCAPYSTVLPLNVRFTATDPDTGIAWVSLLYRFEDGDWQDEGMRLFKSWGVFEFDAPDGEGRYEFYTISANNAGWEELVPATPDAFSYYDITLPSSSVGSPEIETSDTIPVTFSAWDAMSGVEYVDLWYRYEDRDWAKSGYREAATSGTISFAPPDGVGTYYFWTTASDYCGNTEPAPTTGTAVAAVTIFDNVPPKSRVSLEVAYTNESPVAAAFTASDEGVGVASVRLWYNVGGGAYKDTGLVITGATIGVFDFVPIEGDGAYGFYSIAEDNFGNREAVPSVPDDSAVFDTTSPFSRADSPTESNVQEITVSFMATDILSPIESVVLWYRFATSLNGGWSDWADTGLVVHGQAAAGLFPFEASQGEGYYEFYTIARDAAGNVEQPPTSADARTQYRILYPEVSLSHTSYDFGDVEVGTSAFWPLLFVSNLGQAPLTIEAVVVDDPAFVCRVLTPVTIDPLMGMFLPVVFTPTDVGLVEATMTITSNDPDHPEAEVALSGAGVSAALKMSLELDSNGRVFYPGDALSVSVSCHNRGDTLHGVDVYVSLILPNGNVLYLPDFSTTSMPFVSDLDVASGLWINGLELVSVTVPEGLAPGEYAWRAFITWSGQGKDIKASLPLVTTIDIRPEIDLSLGASQSVYGEGQTQVLTARFKNDGLRKTVDFYLALQAPDGSLLFGPELSPVFAPYFDNIELPMFADIWPVVLFNKKLSLLPAGEYAWFAAFSDASTFNLISSISNVEWVLE